MPFYLNYIFDYFEIKDDEYQLAIDGEVFSCKIPKDNAKVKVKK